MWTPLHFQVSDRYLFNTIKVLKRYLFGIQNTVLKARQKLHFYLQNYLLMALEAILKTALLLSENCTFSCTKLHF